MYSFDEYELDKKDIIDAKVKDLGDNLDKLLRVLRKEDITTIVMIEGFESAGRGDMMKYIMRYLDKRYADVATFERVEYKKHKLYSQIFWWNMPKHGHFKLFDRSLYRGLLRMPKRDDHDIHLKNRLDAIKNMEKLLYDDDVIVIKYFLNISKEEQKDRIKKMKEDKYLDIYIDKKDVEENKHYEEYKTHYENIINLSDFEFSPWSIIPSNNIKDASLYVINDIIMRLQSERERILYNRRKSNKFSEKEVEDILKKYPPENNKLSKEEYKKRLKPLQKRAYELQLELIERGKNVVVAFEGIDAAGKGGGIKRLLKYMDPRNAHVHTVASPTEHENSFNYLWRFYRDFPRDREIAIFDRSWYGRVLVERVEGFATRSEWQRAYNEINNMEKELTDSGIIVMKFFLNISLDEQMKRFKEREEDPDKNYKITDDDWRNREKFPDYYRAFNEMLALTNSKNAPWYIISSDDKRYARIQILEKFIAWIEKNLQK